MLKLKDLACRYIISNSKAITPELVSATLRSEFSNYDIQDGKAASVEVLRAQVQEDFDSHSLYPRWIRINTLKSTLDDQTASTLAGYTRAATIKELLGSVGEDCTVEQPLFCT